jgi:hypothetical protein
VPGEEELLDEFLKTLNDASLEELMRRTLKLDEGTRIRATRAMAESLGELMKSVWQNMRLAGEVGSLLKVEDALQDAVASAQEEWEEKPPDKKRPLCRICRVRAQAAAAGRALGRDHFTDGGSFSHRSRSGVRKSCSRKQRRPSSPTWAMAYSIRQWSRPQRIVW